MNMGLFYPNYSKSYLMGYLNVGYVLDPYNDLSQIGYLFTCGGTSISWQSVKQTIIATSSNHAEILALYKASSECIWLSL